MKKLSKKLDLKKVLAFLLYALPVVFFAVCYFVIITSGEDIFQGAKSQIDIFGDAIAAFNHSVRLADMFAWAIINFFDYNFSFGPDIILRLIDVVVALSLFYMATYITLRRRPKLQLSDAAIFSSIFMIFFLTSNGLTLYAGFSKIHNYLFIGFFSFLFGIIYLRDLWGRKTSKSIWFAFAMLLLGFVFGFASNVTAIVFLLTLVIYGIYKLFSLRRDFWKYLKKFIASWRFMGVVGILISLWLMYFVGNGLGDYDTNPAYLTVCDYVPLAEIFRDFGGSLVRIAWHNVYNFGRFLVPFLVLSLPAGIYVIANRLKPKFQNLAVHKDYLVASVIFIIMHVFSMSQIVYPTRLVLPAFIFAEAIFIFVVKELFFYNAPKSDRVLVVFSGILVALSLFVLVLRSYFAFSYVSRITPILDDIRTSETEVYCVDLSTATAESLPYIHLGQEDFLVDWAMPQTIYGKKITYCE